MLNLCCIPWVPEGCFFRSEAAIVSGEAAIEILTRAKKNLSRQDLHRGLASHNRSFATKKTLWHPGYLLQGETKGIIELRRIGCLLTRYNRLELLNDPTADKMQGFPANLKTFYPQILTLKNQLVHRVKHP